MDGLYSTHGRYENAYKILIVRLEGKISLWRPRRRWEDAIKIDLREIAYDDVDWIRPVLKTAHGGLLWTRQWTFGFQKCGELMTSGATISVSS
jgi:hypothetical protein